MRMQDPLTQLIDREVVQHLINNDQVEPHISLAATMVYDSLRHNWGDRFVPISECQWHRVSGVLTIPDLHHAVFMMSLCCPISLITDPVTYILSKTVVQRCMTRKFGTVCIRKFKEPGENGIKTMTKIKQIVLCSFLGNYPHCTASSRTTGLSRSLLYTLLHNTEDRTHDEWFLDIFRRCNHVAVFAIRDYILFALLDSPAMQEHFNSLTNLQNYRYMVGACMSEIRQFLSSEHGYNLLSGSSSTEQGKQAWANALNSIVSVWHDRILKLSYKRLNANLLPLFASLRKKVSLIPLPGAELQISQATPQDITDAEIIRLTTDLGSDLSDDDDEHDSGQNQELLDPRLYLSSQQQTALQQLINRLVCQEYGMLQRVLQFFPYFGVGEHSVAVARQLIQLLHEGSVSREQEAVFARQLQQLDRHAYNLLHVACVMIREAQNIRVAQVLPYHMWKYQLQAVQSKYGLADTQYVVDNSLYFCYCSVCDTVYSLLREFGSVYKQCYQYGYRDAVVEYTDPTGQNIYCKRSKSNHRGNCDDQPLLRVPLLGVVLQYNAKYIYICAQPGCGMPTTYNSELCEFTKYGPACIECTKQLLDTEGQVPTTTNEMCLLCAKPITKTADCVMYPYGIRLCRRQNHPLQKIERAWRKQKPTDKAEATALVVAVHQLHRSDNKARKADYIAKQVRQFKSANRNKAR